MFRFLSKFLLFYIYVYFKIYFIMRYFAWKVVNLCEISLCVEKCMPEDSMFRPSRARDNESKVHL